MTPFNKLNKILGGKQYLQRSVTVQELITHSSECGRLLNESIMKLDAAIREREKGYHVIVIDVLSEIRETLQDLLGRVLVLESKMKGKKQQ